MHATENCSFILNHACIDFCSFDDTIVLPNHNVVIFFILTNTCFLDCFKNEIQENGTTTGNRYMDSILSILVINQKFQKVFLKFGKLYHLYSKACKNI